MIVVEPAGEIAAWMSAKIGMRFRPPYTTMAFKRAGKIVAAFLFHSWTDNDIEVCVAADDMPRPLLRAAYVYVTEQLGCSRATYLTREDNAAAVLALARCGAREEGRLRRFYADGADALVFGILKEEFPYGKRT